MKQKIYRTINKQVIKDWEKLWKKSPHANYTNSPQWFLSVIETFGYIDYVIIAIYEKNELVAAGALVKEKKYGMRVYTVAPGNYICGTPFIFLREDKKIIKALTESLSQIGTVFIDNVPDDFVILLKESALGMDAIVQSVNYYLTLQRDNNGLPIIPNRKKLMHNVRNMEDRFTLQTTYGTTKDSLATVFDIDNESRKQKKGYSTFADRQAKNLFISLAKHFKKKFCIHILYFDRKPIAYEIGFVVGKTYFGNQIAYTAEYMKYSPGKIMIVRLLESLIATGINNLNLGSGDGAIKREITEVKRQLYQVILSKNVLTRNYISCIYNSRNYLFDQLQRHAKIYSIYRKIRKI